MYSHRSNEPTTSAGWHNTDLAAKFIPFAMGDFHEKFLKNHSIVAGCHKLDV